MLAKFEKDGRALRTITKDGEPWFVNKDACDALGISKYRDALSHLDEDERASMKMDTLGGTQTVSIISEPGLYKLIAKSGKPQAKAFLRWLTHDVLPSIRKTGGYTGNMPTVEALSNRMVELDSKIQACEEIISAIGPRGGFGRIAPNGKAFVGMTRAYYSTRRCRTRAALRIYRSSSQLMFWP